MFLFPEPILQVEIEHRMSSLRLEVGFTLREPWTMLFGPSGSGKSTVLRAVAGFVRPARGRVVMGGRVLFDSVGGVAVRPDLRPVRGAGQAARLFPTMDVAQNVDYGAGRDGGGEVFREVMKLFRLEELGERWPRELSGGERQRVSVARAVMAAATWQRVSGRVEGPLLLLDEPFSGMDTALRDALAVGLRGWLRERGVPVLSVSHDVGEAFLLEAEVIRMAEGRVLGQGPVSEVLRDEREAMLERLGG